MRLILGPLDVLRACWDIATTPEPDPRDERIALLESTLDRVIGERNALAERLRAQLYRHNSETSCN